MKNAFLFICALLLQSCFVTQTEMHKKQKELISGDLAKLQWLVGNWQRTNNKKDQQTYEHWYLLPDRTYSGVSYTLADTDTLFQEILLIKQVDDRLAYIVTSKDFPTIQFDITAINNNGFRSQNLKNDFPKYIDYNYSKPKMIAIISDGKQEITFDYQPL